MGVGGGVSRMCFHGQHKVSGQVRGQRSKVKVMLPGHLRDVRTWSRDTRLVTACSLQTYGYQRMN